MLKDYYYHWRTVITTKRSIISTSICITNSISIVRTLTSVTNINTSFNSIQQYSFACITSTCNISSFQWY